MDKQTALKVFEALEAQRMFSERPGEWNPPTYEVRLDAITDGGIGADPDAPRTFRIRVTAGRESGGIGQDEWRYVLDQAAEHELAAVDVQNSGLELS